MRRLESDKGGDWREQTAAGEQVDRGEKSEPSRAWVALLSLPCHPAVFADLELATSGWLSTQVKEVHATKPKCWLDIYLLTVQMRRGYCGDHRTTLLGVSFQR